MKKSVTRKYLPCEIMLFMIFLWGPKSGILWSSTSVSVTCMTVLYPVNYFTPIFLAFLAVKLATP